MYRTTILAGAIASASLALINTPQAQAQGACDSSASRMFQSCVAETREEFWATAARCAPIADDEERGDCIDRAREDRIDGVDECGEQVDARHEVCDLLGERQYLDPLTDETISFVNPDEIGADGMYPNNPYVFLEAGHTYVLRTEETVLSEPDEDEDDPGGEEETEVEIVVVHVTDEVREIEGVPCRVVLDIVLEPGYDEEDDEMEFDAIEVTDDWFAQDTDDNVYYCGEIARNYEDGVLRDLDGSFEAGVEYARGGLLIAAQPLPGDAHRQEYAVGEAEDLVQYVTTMGTPEDDGLTDNENFPCGPAGMGDCLQSFEFSPLEPGDGEYKYFMADVGFVLAVPFDDGEPTDNGSERMICTGDSLDVLFTEDCGFGDSAQKVLDTLCDLADEFCDDGED